MCMCVCVFFKVEDDIDRNANDIMSESQGDVSLSGDSCSRQPTRNKNKTGRCDEVLDLVAKKLQSSSEGKFSVYVKYTAQELDTLLNEMAMYCESVINEAYF